MKNLKRGKFEIELNNKYPDEINAQLDGEFDEKLVHLTYISGIAMGVEDG